MVMRGVLESYDTGSSPRDADIFFFEKIRSAYDYDYKYDCHTPAHATQCVAVMEFGSVVLGVSWDGRTDSIPRVLRKRVAAVET